MWCLCGCFTSSVSLYLRPVSVILDRDVTNLCLLLVLLMQKLQFPHHFLILTINKTKKKNYLRLTSCGKIKAYKVRLHIHQDNYNTHTYALNFT